MIRTKTIDCVSTGSRCRQHSRRDDPLLKTTSALFWTNRRFSSSGWRQQTDVAAEWSDVSRWRVSDGVQRSVTVAQS